MDEPVVFGLAVTLGMPGKVAIYDEVYARLRLRAEIAPSV